MTSADSHPIEAARGWLRAQGAAYRGDARERPLAGYVALMSLYGAGTAATGLAVRLTGRRAPDGVAPWDVALMAVATHRLARTLSKDAVTSPLRAPVTRFAGTSAPAELHEEVRRPGVAHSVGELIECPMCLGQWVATGFCLGLVAAPRLTRLAMATFTAVAGADFLQYVYAYLQQATAD